MEQDKRRLSAARPERYFSLVPGGIDVDDEDELDEHHIEFQVIVLKCEGDCVSTDFLISGWTQCRCESVLQTHRTQLLTSVAAKAAVRVQQ